MMSYIAICLNKDLCGWYTELSYEDYDNFNHQCPECWSIAVTYTSKDKTKITEEEVFEFLLPLINGEIGDSKDRVE